MTRAFEEIQPQREERRVKTEVDRSDVAITQGAPGPPEAGRGSRVAPRGLGRALGPRLCRHLDFGLRASGSVRKRTSVVGKPPSSWSSVTAAPGESHRRRESEGPEAVRDWPRSRGSPEQVRGWKGPRPVPRPPSCPALPPAPSTAPRTLPHPHLQAAAYEERFANAPTSAMPKLASLREWNPDKNTQTQERWGQKPLTTRWPAAQLQGGCPPVRPRPRPPQRRLLPASKVPGPGAVFALFIN